MIESLKIYLPLVPVEHRDLVAASLSSKNIFQYQSLAIKEAYENHVKFNYPPRHVSSKPNPFKYQYDLEVELFLDYPIYQARELEILDEKLKEARLNSDEDKIKRIQERILFCKEKGFTGLPREEHFFNAAQIRWPLSKNAFDQKIEGAVVRNPWIEEQIRAFFASRYVITFGGSGQGKTTVEAAFGIMGWDHFIDTDKGARYSISSVSETKLDGVAWSIVKRLYTVSPDRHQFSLYAGRGVMTADRTIKRLLHKQGRTSVYDDMGCIHGMLAGANIIDVQSIVDKLTGKHGLNFYKHTLDEAQGSSRAPKEASVNMFISAVPHRCYFSMTGNYAEDEDNLGEDCPPLNGWQSIDDKTLRWESKTTMGHIATVLHFNNDLSPGIIPDPRFKKFSNQLLYWWMLPTQAKKDATYPTEESRKTRMYQKLWIGFRVSGEKSYSHISFNFITECHVFSGGYPSEQKLWLSSFDSAPACRDRNAYVEGYIAKNYETGLWTLFYDSAMDIAKNIESDKYFEITTDLMHGKLISKNIPKTNGFIVDDTQMQAHIEMLRKKGYDGVKFNYSESPNKKERRPFKVAFNEGNPDEGLKPHFVLSNSNIANNFPALAAWILKELIRRNQVRFNKNFFSDSGHAGFEKELCLRKSWTLPNGQLCLESKRDMPKIINDSKKSFGSTDYFDAVNQLAFLACTWGLVPGDKSDLSEIISQNNLTRSDVSVYSEMKNFQNSFIRLS